jgi:leucyl/phenylalanyl-tRNA--protein transferase
MFARASDASKIALAHLCRYLERHAYAMIDCQMSTAHLGSLGARTIARREFVAALSRWTVEGPAAGRWPAESAHDLCARTL